jgi:hypothetical protein
MSKKSTAILVSAAMLAVASQPTEAFCPTPFIAKSTSSSSSVLVRPLFAEETKESPDAVFVPPEEEEGKEDEFEFAESLGRGSAKVCLFLSYVKYRRK